ncbi:metallophosphoesterase [Aneurinibacillus tyrosinisolvens]|uniref:metallophosphoesterase n=1 Tax=Aneurinibacillus tyrosinisolvens TaxID=1443435 RepID=UPI00063F959B|nr:metallophosphoesterase [Aneurinibacillus tyrosinisolvens]
MHIQNVFLFKHVRFLVLSFLAFLVFLPQAAYGAVLDPQDGGIGNTTHYSQFQPSFTPGKKVDHIIYPLLSTPAIQKQGTNLTIKVDTQGKSPGGWQISLDSLEQSPVKNEYVLPFVSAKPGTSYWKKDGSIYDVTVKVPSNIPEALYDLKVTYTAGGSAVTDSQAHAVKVVKSFKKNFSFLHLTDIHVASPRNISDPTNAEEAGFWNPDPNKRWLYLQKAIREVNLLKPDFVALTGDLVFGQMNPKEYAYEYEEVYRMLKQLNVPVYIVPGNHDGYAQDLTLTDGLKYWNDYFGPLYFSFNYGPYAHFIGLNSFDWNKIDRSGNGTVSVPTWGGQVLNEQLQWMKDDLAKNAATAQAGQLHGLLAHNNPLFRDRDMWPQSDPEVQQYWKEYDRQHNPQTPANLILGEKLGTKYDQLWHGEGAQEIINLMKQYHVQLGLHGHTHVDNITQQDGILYSTTTSVELTGKPWIGYRIFQMNNGKLDSSYVYENPDRSLPVYQNGDTAGGVMSFEVQYASPNDGTAASQTAVIYNRLNRPVTLYVPFYMEKGVYKTTGGSLYQTETQGDKQAMEVQITIPANSSQQITVSPS